MGALRERSVYATTQPHRILVDFRVNGVDVAAQDDAVVVDAVDATREVAVDVAGTAPIEAVTVVKNNAVWRTVEGTSDADASLDAYTATATWTDDAPITGMSWPPDASGADGGDSEASASGGADGEASHDGRGTDGDVYTVRVRQASDGERPGMAWVGPLWVAVGDDGLAEE